MITLFTFGPFLGQSDSSPFVLKAMALLTMAGLPYQEHPGAPFRAPKGLLPFIEDDGARIADSTFIRFHIEQKYGFDFDRGLSPVEKAISWSIEKMVEEHLYWALLEIRWADADNFRRGIATAFGIIPAPVRPMVRWLFRRRTIRRSAVQGMGRHARADIESLAIRDLAALAQIIGDKPYLMGASPCAADAAVFGMVSAIMTPELRSPIIEAALGHRNLVEYRDRMMDLVRGRRSTKVHGENSKSNSLTS